MRLRQLQHLVALAEQGSFVRAAQASHLSQPAFSRSIDSLEDALQARLVDRAYGAVHFTPVGEQVLTHARAVLDEAQRMRQEVLRWKGLEGGSLHVGVGPFAAGMLGRAALAALVRDHPQLTVRMDMADAGTLCDRLRRRKLDLFIADTRDLAQQSMLDIALLPRVPVAFFARARHPLTRHASVTVEQLLAFPVAGPRLPLDVARFFDRHARSRDRELLNVVCDDPAALRHLALSSQAVILAPASPVFRGETHPLVPLEVAGLGGMKTHYGIVTLVGHTPSPAASAYARHVTGLVAQAPRRKVRKPDAPDPP